jgi:hypothetical protein
MASRRLVALGLVLGASVSAWRMLAHRRSQPVSAAGSGSGTSPTLPGARPLPASVVRRSLPNADPTESGESSRIAIVEGPKNGDSAAADAVLRRDAATAYRRLLAAAAFTRDDARLRSILIDAEDNWQSGLLAWRNDRDEALRNFVAGGGDDSHLAARLDDNGDVLFDRLAQDTEAALVAELGERHRDQVRSFLDVHLRAVFETRPFERH